MPGDVAWTSPGNITGIGAGVATVAGLSSGKPNSQTLRASNFGFTISANATIDGILVRVHRRRQAGASCADLRIQLDLNGMTTGAGDNKATPAVWPGTLTSSDFGGATDKWGLTPTPAQLNSNSFSVLVQVQRTGGTVTANVDYVQAQVFYTTAGGGAGGGGRPELAAWYPQYDSIACPISAIDWTRLTSLYHFSVFPAIPAGGGPSFANRNQFNPPMSEANCNALIAARDASNPNCKILLALGGANSAANFRAALDNQGRAGFQQFVDSVDDIVRLHGYDGVTLDWEVMNCPADDAYVLPLMAALRATLPTESEIGCSFVRTGPANTQEATAKALLDAGSIDYLDVQTYHLAVPGITVNNRIWHHTALFANSDFGVSSPPQISVESALAQFTAEGIPANKIMVGVQAAGKQWDGGGPMSPSVSDGSARQPMQSWAGGTQPVLNHTPSLEKLWRSDIIGHTEYPAGLFRDALAGDMPYFGYRTAGPVDHFLAFDDPTSMKTKAAWARANHFRGVHMWQLAAQYVESSPAGERHPLLNALAEGLG